MGWRIDIDEANSRGGPTEAVVLYGASHMVPSHSRAAVGAMALKNPMANLLMAILWPQRHTWMFGWVVYKDLDPKPWT